MSEFVTFTIFLSLCNVFFSSPFYQHKSNDFPFNCFPKNSSEREIVRVHFPVSRLSSLNCFAFQLLLITVNLSVFRNGKSRGKCSLGKVVGGFMLTTLSPPRIFPLTSRESVLIYVVSRASEKELLQRLQP